jgi:hypothetical protein
MQSVRWLPTIACCHIIHCNFQDQKALHIFSSRRAPTNPELTVGDLHITCLLLEPLVGTSWYWLPWQRKIVMGAIHVDIIEIDDTHGMPPLPQDARAALSRICSETCCSTNTWSPWHLAWARSQGCRTGPSTGTGPGTGPGQPWARARPKCIGPPGLIEQQVSEWIPFRPAWHLGAGEKFYGWHQFFPN